MAINGGLWDVERKRQVGHTALSGLTRQVFEQAQGERRFRASAACRALPCDAASAKHVCRIGDLGRVFRLTKRCLAKQSVFVAAASILQGSIEDDTVFGEARAQDGFPAR